MFRHGKVVGTLHGAESETALRDFISRHVAGDADSHYVAALQACHRGDLDHAVNQAARAALAPPDNPSLAINLSKLLLPQKQYAQADGYEIPAG